ncbi:MAG: MoaD/ThiS family protein [Parvularculaceae bacterium]
MAKVIFYGRLADMMGRERTVAVGAGRSVAALVGDLGADDSDFAAALAGMRVKYAVNDSIAPSSTIVTEEDELAVLPPFSGG